MKKNQKRILAYSLAKVMDNEQLSQVSGGGGVQTTVKGTMKTTLAGPASSDVSFDVSND